MEAVDEALYRFSGSLGAFYLMTNHVHLLIRMGIAPLGKVFHTAHLHYAK